jgi:hypothetical protein
MSRGQIYAIVPEKLNGINVTTIYKKRASDYDLIHFGNNPGFIHFGNKCLAMKRVPDMKERRMHKPFVCLLIH